jgi:hypothetical protein
MPGGPFTIRNHPADGQITKLEPVKPEMYGIGELGLLQAHLIGLM